MESKIERYIPEHPLPEEVQKMERDETVCKYCGVSYLIHNEIKALEDELRKTQQQLEHFKGMESREENLKNELNKKEKHVADLKKLIEGKDKSLRSFQDELRDRNEALSNFEKRSVEYQQLSAASSAQLAKYKSTLESLRSGLVGVKSQLQHLKTESSAIKHQEQSHLQTYCSSRNLITDVLTDVCSRHNSVVKNLQEMVEQSSTEKLNYSAKEKQYLQDIATYEAQLKASQSQAGEQLVASQQRAEQLSAQLSELELAKQKVDELVRLRDLEIVQFKDCISSQTQRLESLQNQMINRDALTEQANIKQQKELKERENELQTVVRELARMKSKFLEQQQDIEKKNSLSNLKTSEMQEQLLRYRADVDALKNEREMMINAHQNQIDELRESFKRKMAHTDSWPDKLAEALQKEKAKHEAEMTSLEQRLKESFVMELQIEKAKHEKLLEKYRSETSDGERELQQQVSALKRQQHSEVSELHKQIAENKARAREIENDLRQEVQSLKKIIADLEQRLSRLDSGSDLKSTEMKHEIKKLQGELNDAKDANKKLETHLNAAKEEVGFLQETVRRECEERFELTEALSVAKEELLALKKPIGGYTQRVSSTTKSPDSSRAANSEELTLFKKINKLPQPPVGSKEFGSASSVTLGYSNESARKSSRANSVSGTRERIANMISRR